MKVSCPTCDKDVEWSDQFPHRPFCSKRCQLIDLGEWAEENHTIPSEPEKSEINIDPEDIEEMLSQQGDRFFKE
ncbi:MAG: DNA gyrase inhibitor YacG [Aestuariibacter sp.]